MRSGKPPHHKSTSPQNLAPAAENPDNRATRRRGRAVPAGGLDGTRHRISRAAMTACSNSMPRPASTWRLDEARSTHRRGAGERAREAERRAPGIDLAPPDSNPRAIRHRPAGSRPAPRRPATPAQPIRRESVAGAHRARLPRHDLSMLRDNLAVRRLRAKLSCEMPVFKNADGTPGARVILVGEAPGSEEDGRASPFVGRSASCSTSMLAADRARPSSVYIANVIPWRRRNPHAGRRRKFVHLHLSFIAPPDLICGTTPIFLICLGAPSSAAPEEISHRILKALRALADLFTANANPRHGDPAHPALSLRQPSQKPHDVCVIEGLLAPPRLDAGSAHAINRGAHAAGSDACGGPTRGFQFSSDSQPNCFPQ